MRFQARRVLGLLAWSRDDRIPREVGYVLGTRRIRCGDVPEPSLLWQGVGL